jgi:hypothetical protein
MHPLSPAVSANTLKSLIMINLWSCIAGNVAGTVGNDVREQRPVRQRGGGIPVAIDRGKRFVCLLDRAT